MFAALTLVVAVVVPTLVAKDARAKAAHARRTKALEFVVGRLDSTDPKQIKSIFDYITKVAAPIRDGLRLTLASRDEHLQAVIAGELEYLEAERLGAEPYSETHLTHLLDQTKADIIRAVSAYTTSRAYRVRLDRYMKSLEPGTRFRTLDFVGFAPSARRYRLRFRVARSKR
ncbi:hypothetical protein DF220_03795 [Salinibacterium hongtaonis]|uniref:Uncharacterized protein n=1 Tax=Homoserinimonas hongtaonis TaxID=2079791 RepID=A0A2U1SZJ6_9MICO|nr:hypothetical protein DF220_03795 [Salinibacterium hongtaonis]